jgi:hypothetical protein
MATKQKTTIGALPYQPVLPGEEIPEQNIATEQALENMMAALERRKQKPFFDPTLLSLAAGFLTPTKTGGFGESLGYAAQNLAGGMDAERKREAENLAFESGVLGQAAAIEQMKRRDKEFARLLGDTGERVPAGVEEIVVKGRGEQGKRISGSEVYTPPGLPPTMGVSFMPPNPNILTSKEYYEIAARDPKISAAEAVKTAQEMERNRYIENAQGVIDRRTGLRFEVTGSDLVERELTNPKTGAVGTYKIPQNIAIRLDHNKLLGNQEAVDFYTRMVFGENMPAPAKASGATGVSPQVSGAAPSAPTGRPAVAQAPTSGIKSVAEKAIDLEAQKTLATELAKTEAEQQTAIVNEGRRAGPTITLGNQLIQLASAPDANEIYGLARNDQKFMAILTDMIGSGIQLGGGYSVSVPVLSDIYRTFKFTPDQQQRYQYALQKFREMAIKMSEFAKGSVSNYEQTLFSQASVNENDLPGTIRMKAEAMKVRAEFEKERAALLRSKDANGKRRFSTTDDLYDSADYENIVAKLDKKYEAILKQNGMLGQAREVAPAQRDSNNPTFPDVRDFEETLQQRRSQQ